MRLQLGFFGDINSKEYHIVNTSISSHLLVLLSYYLGFRSLAIKGPEGSRECKMLQSLRH